MVNFRIENFALNVKVSGTDYQIEIMNNSVLIGVLSGKNSGGGVLPKPTNTSIPTISDTTPVVGQVLTGSDGSWTNTPTSYTRQWYRNGVAIPSATNSTYTVVSADYNLPLTYGVYAINSGGASLLEAVSTATSNVTPLAPVASGTPLITGLTITGETLTVTDGSITGQGTVTIHRQWTKDGIDIGGETGTTYVVDVTDEDHYIGFYEYGSNVAGNSSTITATSVYITDPSLSDMQITDPYSGSDRMIAYTPPSYYNNTDDYPVILYYPGSGERGIPSSSSTSIGTANNVTTIFSSNLSNTNVIIHSTVYVTVNSVQVATGRFGVISGSGVTGTYNYTDSTSAAVSVTFTTAPVTGDVRVYFGQSNMLSDGPFSYTNLGDEPDCLMFAVQISRAFPEGYASTEWVQALDLICANYRVDRNRIYVTGLSLGSDMCNYVMVNHNLSADGGGSTYTWAAFCGASPGSDSNVPGGGSALYTTATNKGKLFVRGSSDSNGANQIQSFLANCNSADREIPAKGIVYWGLGHAATLWDDKVYNRKNRTDAAGSADFDYIEDHLLLYSLDLVQQATNFVRYAELTEKHGDYRVALRQVNNLSASGTKTVLLADLATLKTAIGNSVIVDFGTSFRLTPTVNNMTSGAAGSTAKALTGASTNLVDDTAASTGFTCTLTAATSSTPAVVDDIGSLRLNGRQHGFELLTMRDGMTIDATGTTGTITFGGLNNAHTYTLRIYVGVGGSSFSTRGEVEAVWGGVTKYQYCDNNNVQYIEYNGLTPSSNVIAGTIKQRLTGSTEKVCYLQAMEIIREI
jgi:hypothetical protein